LEQIDPTPPLAVFAEVAEAEELAWRRQLAARLGLPLWRSGQPAPSLLLDRAEGALHLRQPPPARTGRVSIDFSSPELQRRLQGADLLWRAVRGRSRGDLRVLDATAGLGRDAFQLAARGARVDLIERHPVLACLLEDGLQRGRQQGEERVRQACLRMVLRAGEALDWLDGSRRWEVICLDPMFPQERSRAQARKAMDWLQQLLAPEQDSPDAEARLLTAARRCAELRVVVKRPRRAPPLAEQRPDYQLRGRGIRFDVYRPTSPSP